MDDRQRILEIERTVRSIVSHLTNEDNYVDGCFRGDGLLELIAENRESKEVYELEEWLGSDGVVAASIRVNGLQHYDFRRCKLSVEDMRKLSVQLVNLSNKLEEALDRRAKEKLQGNG